MKPLPCKTRVLGKWAKSVEESALLASYWPHACQEILGNEAILMREESSVYDVRHRDDVKCSSWTVFLRVRILAEQEKPKSQRNQILHYEQTETVNHALKVRAHSWNCWSYRCHGAISDKDTREMEVWGHCGGNKHKSYITGLEDQETNL